MKKIEISSEDLEMMNYNDVAHVILEQTNKKMKITELFQEVCQILELDEEEYQSHIADFFELLSTDKRFIMLDDGFWDLRIKHNKGMIIENDEEDEDEDIILEEDSDEVDDMDSMYDDEEKADDDIDDDDLSGLVIIDDTDEENN
jgi:DNA-directed RNA polymerase delta subunit